MPVDDRDPGLIWDMLEAARQVVAMTAAFDEAAYLQDRIVKLAVERSIEIIGEAARRVSPALRARHPEIPWSGIIAQRNVLAHDYGQIDHRRLWHIATVEAPKLIAMLVPLLPDEDR